jgi:hypothetical protein
MRLSLSQETGEGDAEYRRFDNTNGTASDMTTPANPAGGTLLYLLEPCGAALTTCSDDTALCY